MALTSAEYRFDLSDSFGAFLFADAGRVLPELGDLATAGGLRAGYGGGLDLRRGERHLGRLSIASSIDGGLFINAAFDPLGDGEERR
jgi:outer membrane protein assembly factor BamA